MNNKNPLTTDDERDHFPCAVEWWCPEAFFKTVKDNKKWHLNASIAVGCSKEKKVGAMLKTTLFDQDKNKRFEYMNLRYYGQLRTTSRDKPTKPKSVYQESNGFYVRHNESFMKGLFPNYKMFLKDLENNILFDFNLNAKSMPHWAAQDITDGWLTWGLGFYRYSFIPKLDFSGTIKIKNKTYKTK